MVRSSTFPFGSVDRQRIKLLIDVDNDTTVYAQVVYATDGSGITGWIKYHFPTRTLKNESAHLDTPQRLRYAAKWADLFEQCRDAGPSIAASDGGQKSSTEGTVAASISAAVKASPVQPLPLTYTYEYISDAPGFVAIGDADLRRLTGSTGLANGALRRLPMLAAVQPVLVQGTGPNGESPMYLVALDAQHQPVFRMVLYSFKEGDGYGVSTTFNIAKDFTITIRQEKRTERGRVLSTRTKIFRVTPDGKIIQKP